MGGGTIGPLVGVAAILTGPPGIDLGADGVGGNGCLVGVDPTKEGGFCGNLGAAALLGVDGTGRPGGGGGIGDGGGGIDRPPGTGADEGV
mmetsp:Transcript_11894/g.26042  ORF Transcript_11894/g.26042 Transcript_11894/m.26042 type:complete len:90 (+) Transcript_11894:1001-1270(+)